MFRHLKKFMNRFKHDIMRPWRHILLSKQKMLNVYKYEKYNSLRYCLSSPSTVLMWNIKPMWLVLRCLNVIKFVTFLCINFCGLLSPIVRDNVIQQILFTCKTNNISSILKKYRKSGAVFPKLIVVYSDYLISKPLHFTFFYFNRS